MFSLEKFAKKHNTGNINQFSKVVNSLDNKTKGDVSEEFWTRWLWNHPLAYGAITICNTNGSKAKRIAEKYTELKKLGVGTKNSRLVDIIIDYGNCYTLISAKWWANGLPMSEIGSFEALDKTHGYPNLRDKVLITTAPRTSKEALKIFGSTKVSCKIFESEWIDMSDKLFKQIITDEIDHSKISEEPYKPRNERERLSKARIYVALKRQDNATFQGPPGVGKTDLMYAVDRHQSIMHGGMAIHFADSVISIRQNFEHFTQQDRAYGISRPNLIICSGAEDQEQEDLPGVRILGVNSVEIYKWMKENPTGRIFCFYGNIWKKGKGLQTAVKAYQKKYPDFKFTVATFDEASRSVQPIGSGWSHALYNQFIPIRKRFFVDATFRKHKKYGMNVEKLYGKPADVVYQPEAEKFKSICGYQIQALTIDKNYPALRKAFHGRQYIKGQKYTAEDYAMMWQLADHYVKDPNLQHTIPFALTIERCRDLQEALVDVIDAMCKAYPKNKKIQSLKEIYIYTADTHRLQNNEIRSHLNYIYDNNKEHSKTEKKKYRRTVVFTSRLLYRAWSQTKIDGIMFCDNFKSTTYIVQALGRGLRYNTDKPNKLCQVFIPADMNSAKPWQHLITIINRLKGHDFRPAEYVKALIKNNRNKKGRTATGSGTVVINTSNLTIDVKDLYKGLNHVIMNDTDWYKWSGMHNIAKDYMMKFDVYQHLAVSKKTRGQVHRAIYKDLMMNELHKKFLKDTILKTEKREHWKWLRDTMAKGSMGLNAMPEWVEWKVKADQMVETNRDRMSIIVKTAFDRMQAERRSIPCYTHKIQPKSSEATKNLHKTLDNVFETLKKKLDLRFTSEYTERRVRLGLLWGDAKLKNLVNEETRLYIDEQIKITDALIVKGKEQLVEKLMSVALQIHKTEYITLPRIYKYVEKAVPELPSKRFWNEYILEQPFTNKHTKDWKHYSKHPAIAPNRKLCVSCKKAPAATFKLVDGTLKSGVQCWTCRDNKKIKI